MISSTYIKIPSLLLNESFRHQLKPYKTLSDQATLRAPEVTAKVVLRSEKVLTMGAFIASLVVMTQFRHF